MTEEAIIDVRPVTPGYLMEYLDQTQYVPESTEKALENAVAIYKAAGDEQDKYDVIRAKAKRIIAEIMVETGKTKYITPAGTAQVTAPSMIVSYDAKALDALIASDDHLARILNPHRTVRERAGTLTIR